MNITSMISLETIQKIMPPNGEILVRTAGKKQWFVHYSINLSEACRQSIYKACTDDLEKELKKVENIILKKDGDKNEEANML